MHNKEYEWRTREYLVEYEAAGDYRKRQLEDDIIKLNAPLKHKTLRAFGIPPAKYDDFSQEADRGMLQAVRRFKLDKKVNFSTFAVITMTGVIKNCFRDKEWLLTVSRTDKEFGVRTNNRMNSDAADTVSNEDKERAAEIFFAQNPAPLTYELMLTHTGRDDGEENADMEINQQVEELFSVLDPVESLIIEKRFIEGFDPQEISVALLIPQEEVEEIIEQSLAKCRSL